MGLQKPQLSSLPVSELIDAEDLKRALSDLAGTATDAAMLRTAALSAVKAAFVQARARIRRAV